MQNRIFLNLKELREVVMREEKRVSGEIDRREWEEVEVNYWNLPVELQQLKHVDINLTILQPPPLALGYTRLNRTGY